MQYAIDDEGYEVVAASTVDDALAQTTEAPFDAAVLDISMGETDDLAVARKLREAPITARTPIVILSSVEEHVSRERFTAYDRFMSKRADLSGMVKHLKLLIGAATDRTDDAPPPFS